MAAPPPPLLPILLLVLLLHSPIAISRTTPPLRTASLHVSASLAAAHSALSFAPHQTLSSEFTATAATGGNSSSSVLYLHLHSRDFHPLAAAHPDYKSLTLARLRRDSARVRSIAARAALAVHGVKRSDLKPLFSDADADAVSGGGAIHGPIVSGTSQGSGEYFSRVGVGSPPRPQYMVLDTGSDVTWLQCAPCTDCYQQSDPVFDPSMSSSYSPVACGASPCDDLDISACRSGSCIYQVSYGDGSFTVGDFARETLTFGDSSPVPNVAVGCGHDNEGLFVGASGLLGLGGGSLSFPSQISAKSFSYCLVDRDSTASSSLEIGSSADNTAAVAAPLLRNRKLDTFYYVEMTGISVGGEMLSIPSSAFAMDESGAGGVIVDSGTAVTRLQTEAYGSLRDAFAKGARGLPPAAGVALFDTCYDLSSKTSVEVPTVAFHFPAGELRLPAKNYLIPVDSAGTFCLAFAPTTSPLSIVGNVQQQGTRVSIDTGSGVVRFGLNEC